MSSGARSKRVVAYVDGFNIYYGLRTMTKLKNRKRRWPNYYWLNYQKLARQLLLPDQTLEATKYFTALIPSREERQRQEVYLQALKTLLDFEVIRGKYRGREEKMTDVNIAVEMVTDAYEDAFDVALLLSGDADLVPAILRIRDKFPTKRIIAAFAPSREGKATRQATHHSLIIDRRKFSRAQFSNPVRTDKGVEIWKPKKWSS